MLRQDDSQLPLLTVGVVTQGRPPNPLHQRALQDARRIERHQRRTRIQQPPRIKAESPGFIAEVAAVGRNGANHGALSRMDASWRPARNFNIGDQCSSRLRRLTEQAMLGAVKPAT